MIYGRRKIGRTFSNSSFNNNEFLIEDYEQEDEDPFAFSEPTNSTASTSYSLSQFKEQREIGNFSFSSQDSSRWVNWESEND
ncbi:unnamed protein product [Amaranthus hypochondriacus]